MQNTIKPTALASLFTWTIIILDGFSALALGLFYFVLAGIAEPDSRTGSKDGVIIFGISLLLLSFVYFIFCFISLPFWQVGKRNWNYIILGLGLIHLVDSIFSFSLNSGFPAIAYLFYGSLIMNFFLLIIIIVEKNRSKSLTLHSQA